MSEENLLKLVSAISEIKKFTIQFPNSKFYIGKTDNMQRREQEHLLEGYNNIIPIAETSSIDDLNELEKTLIKLSRVFYEENLENNRNGGGGKITDSSIYYIYLASK